VIALLITLGVITLGWLDVSTAMLGGALCMVLIGALNMEEAYQSIDWKSVFLIAGMLPLGVAMERTGTAELLANNIISLVGGGGSVAVLMGIFLLASTLTSVISNAAATVLIIPIAIDTAAALGVNPQPFVMTAVIAASTAFIFPIGHQANIIIFGPGGYKFFDFTRVGLWLNLLLLIVVSLLVPLIWSF
jgi:di/tricarboxylate transporter